MQEEIGEVGSMSNKKLRVAVLPGDGIGKEITESAVRVMREAIGKDKIEFIEGDIGGIAYDNTGDPLPKETVDLCKNSHGILLGAVGGDKWDHLPGDKRPEAGLLRLRKELGVYSNLRPAVIYTELKDSSPLKPHIIGDKLDIMIVRELTGGIYFGEKERVEEKASDKMAYSKYEVERIARIAFEQAMGRRKRITSIDKANVLFSSKLWRETVEEVAKSYPEVEVNHLYIDNAAMQMVIDPSQFDVIVTSNMFGDIISDIASVITGSIGMLPSASMGEGVSLYEPIHGSAPDIAGKNIANPMATIISGAMLMENSLNMKKEAQRIYRAIERVLEAGYRTSDISTKGGVPLGTREITQKIIEYL